MLYNIGDILVCKKRVNTGYLEMTNPDFDIEPGDRYKVIDKDDYTDDNPCHWYELQAENDETIVLNAWNDEGHMILDERFDKVDFKIGGNEI